MAKTPRGAEPAPSSAPAGPPARDRIIDALMALAAEMRWNEITLPMIAERAGVTLADLRDHYPSKGAILGGFNKRIDRIVLEGATSDMLDEPARDRVLDVMMRRLDALAPYKPALREIAQAARRDPLMLAALNGLALNSWRYMLASADLDTEDELAPIRIQGAAIVFARTLETWFDDEGDMDEERSMARTMARLDKELGTGERVMGRLQDLQRLAAPFRGLFRSIVERRRPAAGAAGEPRAGW